LEGINDLYAGVTKREKESLEDLSITHDLLVEITPTLDYIEVQHGEIMAALERGCAAMVKIDKCDRKALAEVKSSIADNATQLRMLEEEVADIQKDIKGSNKRGEDFSNIPQMVPAFLPPLCPASYLKVPDPRPSQVAGHHLVLEASQQTWFPLLVSC